MQRTGTGRSITTRELAAASGLSHGTISNLLTGICDEIPCDNSHLLTKAIGVDVLILFAPTGRCTPANDQPETETADGEAVSA
jgi:transcriptional regulator with XRE-family HTH domain